MLRKLSEFLCSTNVRPGFFPIDRPATGAGSMYGRYLGKSVQFEAQTVGRRKSLKIELYATVRFTFYCHSVAVSYCVSSFTQLNANEFPYIICRSEGHPELEGPHVLQNCNQVIVAYQQNYENRIRKN